MKLKSDQIIDRMKKLAEKRAKIDYKEKLLKEKVRKQKTKRLIEIGNVASRFGIADFDNDILIGAFAEMQERSHDDEVMERWKKKGISSSETSLHPLLISFGKTPSEELKRVLKNKRFKWNSIRKEWQGYGIKEEVEKLIEEFNGKIEVAID